jgi:murein L,D-transpeptidase YcbB/YkuD
MTEDTIIMGRPITTMTSAMQAGFIIITLFLLTGLTASYAITSSKLTSADIANELRQRLHDDVSISSSATKTNKKDLHSPDLLNQFYAQRDYRPAWLDSDNHLLAPADRLLAAIDAADEDGLHPGFYHQQQLMEMVGLVRSVAGFSIAQFADLELLMSDAFFTYAEHMTQGRINPRRLIPDWSWQSRSPDLVALLEQTVTRGDMDAVLQHLQPPHQGYQLLKAALAHYRAAAQSADGTAIDAGKTLHKGMVGARVKALRDRLRIFGDLAIEPASSKTADKEQNRFTEDLHQAVLRFQKRHGLFADGQVGKHTLAALNIPVAERIRQIELNMERWRWLPENLGERHILVNIPGFEMQVIEHGQPVLRSKVVVGREDRPTPVFTGSMNHLVISPYWYVPRTIAIKDKLPILRRNPYALQRQHIRVFNSAGREVNPGRINWYNVGKRNFNYRLRQDPGPNNALGTIKFMFPNQHSVYLHDTSAPELFEEAERAYSSGCIRIAKPMELAEYLLRDDPQWNRETINSAIRQGRQRTVMLDEEIPVHLLYWTVWQDDEGLLNFREDIYQHDQSLVQALTTIETRYAGL